MSRYGCLLFLIASLVGVGVHSPTLAADPAPKTSDATAPADDEAGYIRIAQTYLQQFGRYKGPINGELTLELEKAVRQFQEAMGIPPDGRVNRLLVNLLVDAGRPGYAPQ